MGVWEADSEKDSKEDGMRKYGAIGQSSREEVRWKKQVEKTERERERTRRKQILTRRDNLQHLE